MPSARTIVSPFLKLAIAVCSSGSVETLRMRVPARGSAGASPGEAAKRLFLAATSIHDNAVRKFIDSFYADGAVKAISGRERNIVTPEWEELFASSARHERYDPDKAE